MTTEPLPCPFCGESPEVKHRDGYIVIECHNDECRVSVQACEDEQDGDALAIWNRRKQVHADLSRRLEKSLRRMVELLEGRELARFEPWQGAIREAKEVLK